MVDFDIFPEGIKKAMERRDFVCAHVPPCPNCREQIQIQVKDYFAVPAKWKCRICKHPFEYDPPKS